MINTNLLFDLNPESCSFQIKLTKDKRVVINIKDENLDGCTIKKVIKYVNWYKKKYAKLKIPLIFNFVTPNIKIVDKLCYTLLETILYSIIVEMKIFVQIYWQPLTDILTSGLNSSPLLLLNTNDKSDIEIFCKRHNMEIFRNHFRKVINGFEKTNTNYLGSLYEQVDTFLKFFSISEDNRNQVAEVVSELVGNACEHANSDCLVDIDITDDYQKQQNGEVNEGKYYGINIVVVNYSNSIIGDALKEKLKDVESTNPRYEKVKNALEFHKKYFDEEYDEIDFYNISVFQDRISGRKKNIQSGGTGLTLLIKSLQEKSDGSNCYMISGDRSIFFFRNLLEYTNDNWLGFNETHSYVDDIPDKQAIGKCHIFMPGTAYNLNFIMKREE